ncbi:MAG: hypothetical protein U0361_04720 [Nitrospiraceae bacterium]
MSRPRMARHRRNSARNGATGCGPDGQMHSAAVRTFLNENPRAVRWSSEGINRDVVVMVKETGSRWSLGTPIVVAPSVMFATEDHVTTC